MISWCAIGAGLLPGWMQQSYVVTLRACKRSVAWITGKGCQIRLFLTG